MPVIIRGGFRLPSRTHFNIKSLVRQPLNFKSANPIYVFDDVAGSAANLNGSSDNSGTSLLLSRTGKTVDSVRAVDRRTTNIIQNLMPNVPSSSEAHPSALSGDGLTLALYSGDSRSYVYKRADRSAAWVISDTFTGYVTTMNLSEDGTLLMWSFSQSSVVNFTSLSLIGQITATQAYNYSQYGYNYPQIAMSGDGTTCIIVSIPSSGSLYDYPSTIAVLKRTTGVFGFSHYAQTPNNVGAIQTRSLTVSRDGKMFAISRQGVGSSTVEVYQNTAPSTWTRTVVATSSQTSNIYQSLSLDGAGANLAITDGSSRVITVMGRNAAGAWKTNVSTPYPASTTNIRAQFSPNGAFLFACHTISQSSDHAILFGMT